MRSERCVVYTPMKKLLHVVVMLCMTMHLYPHEQFDIVPVAEYQQQRSPKRTAKEQRAHKKAERRAKRLAGQTKFKDRARKIGAGVAGVGVGFGVAIGASLCLGMLGMLAMSVIMMWS